MLGYQVLNKMDVLHRNVSEALRMQPPLVMLLRMSHKNFTVTTSKGETIEIPKGHVIATSPAYQHKMDSVFPVCFSCPLTYHNPFKTLKPFQS